MTQDRRATGHTRDTGFQVGARRTIPIRHEDAWQFLTSREGVRIWLHESANVDLARGAIYCLPDGTTGEVRVFVPYSHLRMTWHPPAWPRPSTIQLRVIANDERSVVAFHHEHLPGPNAREARYAHYTAVLDTIEQRMTSASEVARPDIGVQP